VPLYDATIPQLSKMLKNLDRWLDKATAHAEAKKFDPAVLLTARLAPDQYPLLKQIQAACDSAKSAAAHLSGKELPKHPDHEQTLPEIKARIHTCLAFLETITPEDFEGAETRRVSVAFLPGKVIMGADYLNEMALPNFYFHVTTAYAILRHNGVEVGKYDYIGSLKLQDAS
jgi:uncharacterized protein